MLKAYNPDSAPKVLGPYSHAVLAGPFLYVSGQLPIYPSSGKIETFTIEEQTNQVLQNLQMILTEAGASFEQVVRCDIFLKDLGDFSTVNRLYEKRFHHPIKPARQTVEVSRLPLDALIEISCIAYMGS